MGEGTQHPVGERRRRREAARAAELAAERAGASRPLTRRELRWREAEEAARLEAIATGELRVSDVQEALERSVGGNPTSSDSATSAPVPGTPTTSTGSAVSATSSTTAPARPPSRRSMRDRARDAQNDSPEGPTERTATGRRPVVRTPTTAQGIRVLDATGQLTGIQPVVRPDEPSSESPSDAVAVDSDHFTVELDGPARMARDALAASSLPASAASSRPGNDLSTAGSPRAATSATTGGSSSSATSPEPPREGDAEPSEDSGEFTLRPQWVAISGISGVTPDEAVPLPSRRSVRTPVEAPGPTPSEPSAQDTSSPRNPAVTLVKVAVLVAVAVILGALIWLLWNEALGDDSAAAPHTPTIVAAPYFEETSAR